MNPLHAAAESGSVEIVNWFLKDGHDPNACNNVSYIVRMILFLHSLATFYCFAKYLTTSSSLIPTYACQVEKRCGKGAKQVGCGSNKIFTVLAPHFI